MRIRIGAQLTGDGAARHVVIDIERVLGLGCGDPSALHAGPTFLFTEHPSASHPAGLGFWVEESPAALRYRVVTALGGTEVDAVTADGIRRRWGARPAALAGGVTPPHPEARGAILG